MRGQTNTRQKVVSKREKKKKKQRVIMIDK